MYLNAWPFDIGANRAPDLKQSYDFKPQSHGWLDEAKQMPWAWTACDGYSGGTTLADVSEALKDITAEQLMSEGWRDWVQKNSGKSLSEATE